MQKAFVTLPSGRQVHYRTLGNGAPLVMLHQSPQNSEALEPAMGVFSEICRCIALDTPGYGLSDPLFEKAKTIGDYAEATMEAIDALGIDRFCLYGVATGSQVGIEIAKRYPGRVHFLLLDANGHLSADERKIILDGYFPEVTPGREGGHLLTYWDMCKQLFVSFPWHSGQQEDRLPLDQPPAEVIHTILMRYLDAGEGYASAYRIAFDTEDRAHLDGLDVPTTMMRWEGSAALSMTDALLALGLPDCVKVLNAGPSIEKRYAIQLEALRQAAATLEPLQDKSASSAPGSGAGRAYIDVGGEPYHCRLSRSGDGHPLVLLHDLGQSSVQIHPAFHSAVGKRPVLALDLPGHGDSSHEPGALSSFGDMADRVADVLLKAGFQDTDIVGYGFGGALAIAVSERLKSGRAVAIDPLVVDKATKSAFQQSGLTGLQPHRDGRHLLAAFTMARDAELFWPWFDQRKTAIRQRNANLDPAHLHQKTVDILKMAGSYQRLTEVALSVDWEALFAQASADVTVTVTKDHPCPGVLESLTDTVPAPADQQEQLAALGLVD